jgi:hypothetical protein
VANGTPVTSTSHARAAILTWRWIYERRDLAEAQKDLAQWLERWGRKYPKLCEWVEEGIAETLNFYRLPLLVSRPSIRLQDLQNASDVREICKLSQQYEYHYGRILLNELPRWMLGNLFRTTLRSRKAVLLEDGLVRAWSSDLWGFRVEYTNSEVKWIVLGLPESNVGNDGDCHGLE